MLSYSHTDTSVIVLAANTINPMGTYEHLTCSFPPLEFHAQNAEEYVIFHYNPYRQETILVTIPD